MTIVWLIIGVVAIVALFLILRNFRKQADFKDDPAGIVPEDYD